MHDIVVDPEVWTTHSELRQAVMSAVRGVNPAAEFLEAAWLGDLESATSRQVYSTIAGQILCYFLAQGESDGGGSMFGLALSVPVY
ncbi:MAG: hypothetical protein M3198_19395, partial [Actinomycetota bacterium]|nr:hypothetical protein [Actinomycetota bacterium]